MCPFSILAFLQPTTVDKEPIYPFSSLADFNPLQLTKSQKSNGKSVAFFGDKRLLSQTQILAFLQPTIVDNEPLKISSTKMQSFFL